MTISSNEDDMPPPFTDPNILEDYYFLQQSAISLGKRTGVQHGTEAKEAKSPTAFISKSPVRRLPTPDKVRILEMADSFNKHRLRKQQQLLSEIAQRCREQEISDLSSEISKKCTFSNQDVRLLQKEMTFSNTTSMGRKVKDRKRSPDGDDGENKTEIASPTCLPMYERSKSFFPGRKPKPNPTKDYALHSLPPMLQFCYRKGVHPYAIYNQSNLVKSHKINGPIQMGLYQPRVDKLAPLILPSVKFVGYTRDKNYVKSYVSSSKISLEPRRSASLQNMSGSRQQKDPN